MASTRACFAAWKIVFCALLLLAFNVSARNLVGTNVVARIASETAVDTNDGRAMGLFNQVLDDAWKGHYHPPNKFDDQP